MSELKQFPRKRTRNCGKSAKLNSQGFKVRKNFKIYVGKATKYKQGVRPQVLDVLRDLWNNDPSFKHLRKYIKELSIRYSNNPESTGTWNNEKRKIVINDCASQNVKEYRSIFIHEGIGHAFWDFARIYRREELTAFNELANKLDPVSTYVREYEKLWRQINDDGFTEKEGYYTMTRYANEQHSAITEIIYRFGGHKTLLNDSDLHKIITLWEALHY